jgi:hypothetical protein
LQVEKLDYNAIGNEFRHYFNDRIQETDIDPSKDFTMSWTRKNLEFAVIKPDGTRTAGEVDIPQTIPSFIAYDKLVLAFHAYFKGYIVFIILIYFILLIYLESVHESREEVYRLRRVDIAYHLEDDTIEVLEHKQENSGIPQGTFLKRHRVPRDEFHPEAGTLTLDDLGIGRDVTIYGRVFHIYDVNGSTRDYLEKEYGKRVAQAEPIPYD